MEAIQNITFQNIWICTAILWFACGIINPVPALAGEISREEAAKERVINYYIKDAQQAIAKGDTTSAVKNYDHILKLDPKNSDAVTGKHDIQAGIEAKILATKIKHMLQEARQYLDDHNLSKAEKKYREVIKLAPNNSEANNGVLEIIKQGKKPSPLYNKPKHEEIVRSVKQKLHEPKQKPVIVVKKSIPKRAIDNKLPELDPPEPYHPLSERSQ